MQSIFILFRCCTLLSPLSEKTISIRWLCPGSCDPMPTFLKWLLSITSVQGNYSLLQVIFCLWHWKWWDWTLILNCRIQYVTVLVSCSTANHNLTKCCAENSVFFLLRGRKSGCEGWGGWWVCSIFNFWSSVSAALDVSFFINHNQNLSLIWELTSAVMFCLLLLSLDVWGFAVQNDVCAEFDIRGLHVPYLLEVKNLSANKKYLVCSR